MKAETGSSASVALLALVAGCSFAELRVEHTATPQHCKWNHVAVDAVAGTASLVAGTVLLVTAESGTEGLLAFPKDLGQKAAGATLIAGSLVGIASAFYGYSVVERCEEMNRDLAREQARRDVQVAQRAQAWTLTREAAAAARASDCSRVTVLDAQVRVVDAEFHDTVFLADVAIARCLDHSIK